GRPCIGMNADVTEVVAKAPFEEVPGDAVEGMAGGAQHLGDYGGRGLGLGAEAATAQERRSVLMILARTGHGAATPDDVPCERRPAHRPHRRAPCAVDPIAL